MLFRSYDISPLKLCLFDLPCLITKVTSFDLFIRLKAIEAKILKPLLSFPSSSFSWGKKSKTHDTNFVFLFPISFANFLFRIDVKNFT